MTGHKSTKRYVDALFNLSVETDVLTKVYKDLKTVSNLLDQSEELVRFVRMPVIPLRERNEVLNKLFKGKVAAMTLTFLLFLSDQDKLYLLKEICEEFEIFYLDHQDILRVKIVSAYKMQKKQVDAIAAKLEKYYKKKIETEPLVDDALLGGFKVFAKDRIYDLTISTQLQKYRTAVMTT